MRIHSFIAAGVGSALAMVALAGLKIPATPAFSAPATSAQSASEPAFQIVNRTLKGDRSLGASISDRGATSVPGDIVIVPELLDGCEPVISSIGNSPLARIAGSCLS